MKAMVLRAPSDLVPDEVARPQPGAGQVLVRITHSGVCGTDYKIYNGSIPVNYPLIMGHEMAGEVVDVGQLPRSGPAEHPAIASSSIPKRTAACASIAGSGRRISARTER